MIAEVGRGEGEEGWGEEHGFIVWMGDEEDDAFLT